MHRPFALVLVSCAILTGHLPAQDVATDLTRAARAWLESLDASQREAAVFAFGDAEREDWHFIPRARHGLPLKRMTPAQRELAHRLLASALSARGHETTRQIISLEDVLAGIEGDPVRRDPENYYFSLFGTPGTDPWGWRCEGHHVSLNITVAGGNVVVTTPQFFGANPAQVRTGTRQGFRALGSEEDLGRAFVKTLSAEQRKQAVILERAPNDVFAVPGRNDVTPAGIAWGDLQPAQQVKLLELVRHYVDRFRPEVATEAMERLEKVGHAELHFAWAGGLEVGDAHYYRVQADWFVVEYDNTQNGANHVHTVWREFGREFGHDALGEHYQAAHAK